MPKITEMFAFIAEDSGPDDEGVIGAMIGKTMMPLLGADMARVDSLRGYASMVAKQTGKPIKLVKFTTRVELEEING